MAEISGVQHQRRRAINSQLNIFTGSTGELAADMTFLRTSVMDGSAPGGWVAKKANITYVNNVTYTIKVTDAVVMVINNTAGINLNLPSASAYPTGQRLVVSDGSGQVAVGKNILVHSASTTDLIEGVSYLDSTTVTLSSAWQSVNFVAASTSRWAVWE